MSIPRFLIKANDKYVKVEGTMPAVTWGFSKIVESLLESGMPENVLRTVFENSLLPKDEQVSHLARKVKEEIEKLLDEVGE